MGAPVCTLPNQPPTFDSTSPSLPSIPPATDLQSTITAVNALRQYIIGNRGGGPPQNNTAKTNRTSNQKKDTSNFVEIKRNTTKVKVYNPDDHTQWVEVKQITMLTFKNKATGETWTWNQGDPLNG